MLSLVSLIAGIRTERSIFLWPFLFTQVTFIAEKKKSLENKKENEKKKQTFLVNSFDNKLPIFVH